MQFEDRLQEAALKLRFQPLRNFHVIEGIVFSELSVPSVQCDFDEHSVESWSEYFKEYFSSKSPGALVAEPGLRRTSDPA